MHSHPPPISGKKFYEIPIKWNADTIITIYKNEPNEHA